MSSEAETVTAPLDAATEVEQTKDEEVKKDVVVDAPANGEATKDEEKDSAEEDGEEAADEEEKEAEPEEQDEEEDTEHKENGKDAEEPTNGEAKGTKRAATSDDEIVQKKLKAAAGDAEEDAEAVAAE